MDYNTRDMFLYKEPRLNCKVTLQNTELWEKFHKLETEMIITKSGRRMFPALRVQFEHLDPNVQYCVLVEMVPVSKCRYRYSASGGWAPAGAEEAQSPNRVYLHPESPASGHHWMSQIVTFGRLKLTNSLNPPAGQIVLTSMHKYQPRIIVAAAGDARQIPWAPHIIVTFVETQFIAVTAYQNDQITKLKIDNNPFAKGFRENGQSKSKRKMIQEEEIVVDDVEIKQEPKRVCSDSDTSSERTSSPELPATSSGACLAPCLPYTYPYPLPLLDVYNHYYYYPSSYTSPYYNQQCLPQDLRVQKVEKPKKLTDFSIRAITGIS